MGAYESYDIIIVGAGIVGLAAARALNRRAPSLRLGILEKEEQVARHQTGHNSGVLHTGIYYAPGSLKAKNCTLGRVEMLQFCREEAIPHEVCGKLIVATRPEELAPLAEIQRRGGENQVRSERVTQTQLKEIEPEVSGIEGLYVPDAGIVDYISVAERLKLRLEQAGVTLHLRTKVIGFCQEGSSVLVETRQERFSCRFVVNCGGLQSDRLAALGGAPPGVQIVPFRGEYYELSEGARGLVRHLIYPVPRPEFPFLGVHFTRGVHGDVECGPNALLNLGRETYEKGAVDLSDLSETLVFPGFLRLAAKYHQTGIQEVFRSLSKGAFLKSAQALIPRLEARHLIPAPAGIRAQAVSREGELLDDFAFHESEYVLSVLNAPSPAATASLRIGEDIAARVERALRDRVSFC